MAAYQLEEKAALLEGKKPESKRPLVVIRGSLKQPGDLLFLVGSARSIFALPARRLVDLRRNAHLN
jgi:hypothetical protein